MSCIHFKFKSSLDYEKLTFEGLQISLSEFKEAIMKQKKIGLANQYTLKVVDAQSKKVYSKDDEMLQRNTSVIICRIPLVNAPKIPKTQLKDPSLGQPVCDIEQSSCSCVVSINCLHFSWLKRWTFTSCPRTVLAFVSVSLTIIYSCQIFIESSITFCNKYCHDDGHADNLTNILL